MKISRSAVDRLLKINWFINIGKVSVLNNIKQVANESDFIKEITSADWEDATLEAGNEITGYLAKKHTNDYQQWNVLVREAKKIIDAEVIPIVKDKGVSENIILENIKWDLVNFLMEDAYKRFLKGNLFFESLIVIYEDGHIPCGWEGTWPLGKLIIY
ncbi:hypothetical protein N5923_08845 [Erwiniaceae bacterium BAC15a-03b]|uniref:Uncharacterized protein n=1 Tax=Winslowiella arboricola TaxID=2978220 RepID=A0A9J6PLG0_9GAMM|nr:hypothetical protein [Winslowiella arboricola]MCU5771731.1 hypothetical protein [Winslowiella arboricola]MCU5777598.1 hypothetical protein [Winslowiella arboricola]